MHFCKICNKELENHTIDEITKCYYSISLMIHEDVV